MSASELLAGVLLVAGIQAVCDGRIAPPCFWHEPLWTYLGFPK